VNLSALFIRRPVATTLLTLGLALAGIAAYFVLPVSPLPSVDIPTISVNANLPGASPDVMATSVATPLERRLGQIADVTEMTSSSSVSRTNITLQFGLDRDINGAARDVQAAINAARADLPTTLRSNPTYRKVNPADAPILILTLSSPTLTKPQIYDAASTVIQQKLSQVSGVGEVDIGGGAQPAVRVELNPGALANAGIGLEDVRAAIAASNANQPKGAIVLGGQRLQIYTNDQGYHASDYASLVIAYRNSAPVRLSDIADVRDGPEDERNAGVSNGHDAMVVLIRREPGANVIATVERIKALLPELRGELPPAVNLDIAIDRTTTIRGSLAEVERSLLISIVLVVLVVLVFLRSGRATLIPGVAVAVSLLGTLGIMFLLGFSLDNLSLMALTVATGFVVDDAIVVLENITRHVEDGMPRMQAALRGAQEVGFTVVSISVSLIAVFLPILLMGGLVGRLFREFAMVLSSAILISLAVSLTTTPMMAARLIDEKREHDPNRRRGVFSRISGWIETGFGWILGLYERSLRLALKARFLVLLILFGTIALNVYLYVIVPKGFFPQQDTGALNGGIRADQTTSFAAMNVKLRRFVNIVHHDPAVATVTAFVGGGQSNTGFMFVSLKSKEGPDPRKISADEVVGRLRPKLMRVPGAQLFLQSVQDIRTGGRAGNAQYQYTLMSDDLNALRTWSVKLTEAMKRRSDTLTEVDSDQQERGLESYINVDRPTASRLGLTSQAVDNVLNDAFSQRQVSTIYNPLNQYFVIMEVAAPFRQNPNALQGIYVTPATTAQSTVNVQRIGPAGVAATTTATSGQVGGAGLVTTSAGRGGGAGGAPGGSGLTTASTSGGGGGGGGSTLATGAGAGGLRGGLTGGVNATSAPSVVSSITGVTGSSQTSQTAASGSVNAPGVQTSGQGATTSALSGSGGVEGAGTGGSASAGSATVSGSSGSGATSNQTTASGGGLGGTAGSPLNGAGVQRSTTGGGASGQPQTGVAVSTSAETMVPLSAFAAWGLNSTPLAVNHQDRSVATTISYNLAPGKALSDAQALIEQLQAQIHMPANVRGSSQGTAQVFQQSLASEPVLILAALVAVYVVLGVLYESYVHPITVLSTLPSAGLGATLALLIFNIPFDIIALIGVILLIGIVKKNAILIIDFALVAEREEGLSSYDAICKACMLRFRPILMTTMAAIFGALPLALGLGEGGEIRRPLGVAIIGGLVVSQILTLLTTPVVYLYLDKLRRPRSGHVPAGAVPARG